MKRGWWRHAGRLVSVAAVIVAAFLSAGCPKQTVVHERTERHVSEPETVSPGEPVLE